MYFEDYIQSTELENYTKIYNKGYGIKHCHVDHKKETAIAVSY